MSSSNYKTHLQNIFGLENFDLKLFWDPKVYFSLKVSYLGGPTKILVHHFLPPKFFSNPQFSWHLKISSQKLINGLQIVQTKNDFWRPIQFFLDQKHFPNQKFFWSKIYINSNPRVCCYSSQVYLSLCLLSKKKNQQLHVENFLGPEAPNGRQI